MGRHDPQKPADGAGIAGVSWRFISLGVGVDIMVDVEVHLLHIVAPVRLHPSTLPAAALLLVGLVVVVSNRLHGSVDAVRHDLGREADV